MVRFHIYVLRFITIITVFVLALLVYVIVKFNAVQLTPSRTTHNTLIEVLWTVIPVLILVAIALPSFRFLFIQLNVPPSDLTIKATGVTWNWKYNYPDNGISSSICWCSRRRSLARPAAAAGRQRDGGTGQQGDPRAGHRFDVIHAFAVPSFGVKVDAIPGRLNETWFKATKEGWYYGQCSELCGKDHAFMPIAVRVVSDAEFATWIEEAKKKFAGNGGPTNVATAHIPAE